MIGSPGPLFDHAAARDARARADVGMARASGKAERIESGWRELALNAVYLHALHAQHFLAEDVDAPIPQGADPRAFGAVMQEAKRKGWIVADGAAPANSSNRSFKVRWRSLIYDGARA